MNAAIFVLLTLGFSGNQVAYNCNRITKIEHLPGAPYTTVSLTDTMAIQVSDTPQSIVERCNNKR